MNTWKTKLLGLTSIDSFPTGGISVYIQRIDSYTTLDGRNDMDITLASSNWLEESIDYAYAMSGERIRVANKYPVLKLFKAYEVTTTQTDTIYYGEFEGELYTLILPSGSMLDSSTLLPGIRK